ncbi:MAG: DNA mismatch repair protein MutL, partial [Lachnospiraceae bacterium]|nr:DNA mismatch repair protein MutL [Lachnospiraceae bacterium]
EEAGFEVEHFGGREYAIRAVPDNLYGFTDGELFIAMLDSLNEATGTPSMEFVFEKLAGMACKAAIKGNHRYSVQEADALIGELLQLDNPYNCPHGRPTIIMMSKTELERKFRRIVS